MSVAAEVLANTLISRNVRLRGQIQGVGFRPFTVRLAKRYGVCGWVRNLGGEVEIHAEGRPDQISSFVAGLTTEAPPLAKPEMPLVSKGPFEHHQDFRIVDSGFAARGPIVVPPDHFVCPDCLAEMADPEARRYCAFRGT